ncbi:hypothetical protein WDZ92_11130 [Nostoc sp. NIES-2111]
MQIMNVNYKRILNLGNYESKHLEISIEIHEGDNVDEETSRLMELVERKIREDFANNIEAQIKQLKTELQGLREAKRQLQAEILEAQSKLETDVPLEDYLDNDDDENEEDGF